MYYYASRILTLASATWKSAVQQLSAYEDMHWATRNTYSKISRVHLRLFQLMLNAAAKCSATFSDHNHFNKCPWSTTTLLPVWHRAKAKKKWKMRERAATCISWQIRGREEGPDVRGSARIVLGYKIRPGLTSGITNCPVEMYTEEGWLGEGNGEEANKTTTKKKPRKEQQWNMLNEMEFSV